MHIIPDTISIIAEYIDPKLYQIVTLTNKDFYWMISKYNTMSSKIFTDQFEPKKYDTRGGNYDIDNDTKITAFSWDGKTYKIKRPTKCLNINYYTIKYLMEIKKDPLTINNQLIFLSGLYCNDFKLVEYFMRNKYYFPNYKVKYYMSYIKNIIDTMIHVLIDTKSDDIQLLRYMCTHVKTKIIISKDLFSKTCILDSNNLFKYLLFGNKFRASDYNTSNIDYLCHTIYDEFYETHLVHSDCQLLHYNNFFSTEDEKLLLTIDNVKQEYGAYKKINEKKKHKYMKKLNLIIIANKIYSKKQLYVLDVMYLIDYHHEYDHKFVQILFRLKRGVYDDENLCDDVICYNFIKSYLIKFEIMI
jgi:hypothetical protein